MGKVTGFLEIERQDRGYEKPEMRVHNYKEFVHPLSYGEVGEAGRALHGLRHSLLPSGLPGQQSDPRLEQSGLSRPVAHGVGHAALHQQFSGIHRPRLPRALRSLLHPQHPGQSRHHQNHRMPDRGSRLGRRLDPARRSRPRRPARPWRWWDRVRRAWRARSNWRAPVIPSPCSKSPTASAGCCVTAFPISRWKSI